MNFLGDIAVAIIGTYLAMTGALAGQINEWLEPAKDSQPAPQQTPTNENSLPILPGGLSQRIPDILLQNAKYQQAALPNAVEIDPVATTDPLEAIVNIFCTFTTPQYIKTTTGTGFFIDADGIIMTNAHVAQFLLLEETDTFGQTKCIVRSGNPAAPTYNTELLYLPPAWVQENASMISQAAPIGTGERDYALLYVTSRIDRRPLPAHFPALKYKSTLLPTSVKNTQVTAAGYPAEELLARGASVDLIPIQAETSISELYTFGSNYADVFSIRGSAVGAQGASGGPIVNEDKEVIGIIVTRGDDLTDGPGSLRAITLSHVARTIEEETGFTLTENLQGNIPYRAQVFAETLTPFLVSLLENEQ